MKINTGLQTRIRYAYLLGAGPLVAAVIAACFLIDSRIDDREKDATLIDSIAQLRHPDANDTYPEVKARYFDGAAPLGNHLNCYISTGSRDHFFCPGTG